MRDGSRAAAAAPNSAPNTDASDVYEVLVAELAGRRERLRQLLRMVVIEARRQPRKRAANLARANCKGSATRPL
jgi:hypothetical protein